MATTFYHIPGKVYNETEICDLIDNYKPGDTVLVTVSGNALVNEATAEQIKEIEEMKFNTDVSNGIDANLNDW